MEDPETGTHEDEKNDYTPYDSHNKGTHQKMAESDGGHETMLKRFAPDIIEEHIGDIKLANLDSTHGDNPDKDERLHLRLKGCKFGKKSDGQKANHRPEQDLQPSKYVPSGHDPVFEDKGPCLCHLIL